MAKKKQLKITQKKSIIGSTKRQKLTMKALGFHKNYGTIIQDNTPVIHGMIRKVEHLVDVEEV